MKTEAALTRVRKICLALPDVSERASHGAPSWFWKAKSAFCHFVDNHHGDGRLALWCAASEGAQAALVEQDDEVFFVPPYVGPSGWIGMRLDRRAPWPMIEAVIGEAYRTRVSRAKKPRSR